MKKFIASCLALALGLAVYNVRAEEAKKDIVETATAAGQFKTLLTALTQAELADTLKGKGPFTVFAPTDEAFKKIPEADLKAVLADKNKLTKILKLHVVEGKVLAADVVKLDGKKVNGLTIHVKDSEVMLGKAKVVKTDISASNGVIHIIDTVLMPE